jgi:hypothetical protein
MQHDLPAPLRNGTRTTDSTPDPKRNEIVVYQPDETLRLDVRLENETVWLTQGQMASLFGCSSDNVGLHLRNIYSCGELSKEATAEDFSVVRLEGGRQVRRSVCFYNLDAIISVGYRVNSILGVRFRQWATSILKDYLLRGYAVNERLVQIEDRMDRRLAEHGRRLDALEGRVDFFVRTQTPPLQGVFYDGQLWDARAFVDRLVKRAKRSLVLVDSWATVETLDMLAAKQTGVAATVVTSEHRDGKGNPRPMILPADVAKFNAQYPTLSVRFRENFHDRFLVIDDRELYLLGASLKDLGRKCFGFTKMDASEIPGLKARM